MLEPPDKPRHWIIGRYFGKFSKFRNDRWMFGDKDTSAYLPKPSWTDIVRHIRPGWRETPCCSR